MVNPPPNQSESDWHLDSMLGYAKTTQSWIEQQVPTPSTLTINTLIHSFVDVASAYYRETTRAVASLPADIQIFERHAAIEKLAEEWSRIAPVVQVAAVSTDTPFALLSQVVKGASQSLRLDLKRSVAVVPHFGRHFELIRFHYAPDIALLGMPVFALQTPWEWSVIWHELAGLLVEQPRVRQLIDAFLEESQAAEASIWHAWEAKYATAETALANQDLAVNRAPLGAALAVFAEPSFDHHGWVKECVEDACSVLTLGPTGYSILSDVLRQRHRDIDERSDARHPPPGLRLEVAYQLLRLMAQQADQQFEQERFHGKAKDDSGAATLARWIYDQQAEFVVSAFDWDDDGADEDALMRSVREVAERSAMSDAPMAKVLRDSLIGDQGGDNGDLLKLVRRIVIKARKGIADPQMGLAIWQDAQSRLSQLLGLPAQLAGHRVAYYQQLKSQAGPFIAAQVKGKSMSELHAMALSETDFLSVTMAGEHSHSDNPANKPAWISVTITGKAHNGFQHAGSSRTYKHVHPSKQTSLEVP